MDWIEKILPSVAAVIIGIITYLLAPRVHWVFEQKKRRLENRHALIADARSTLDKIKFNAVEFRESGVYSRIRPFLSSKLIKEVETVEEDNLVIQVSGRGRGVNNFKSAILDEIAKLEKEWELI